MKMGIYKITNLINGKVYVGQTANYDKRKRGYIKKLNANGHHNEHLQKDWKEMGRESFSFEFLYECSEGELDYMEMAVKKELNSISGGYNLVDGGRKIRWFSPDLKKKMSNVLKGRKFTEGHKDKISLSQRGKIISEEAIRKSKATNRVRQTHLGQKNPNALISDKEASDIITSLLQNAHVSELAERYDVSIDVIYNLLYNRSYTHIMPNVREDLKRRVAIIAESNAIKVIDLYNGGMSQNKISIKLNMSRNTIREILKSAMLNTQKHKNQYVNTEVTSQISKG